MAAGVATPISASAAKVLSALIASGGGDGGPGTRLVSPAMILPAIVYRATRSRFDTLVIAALGLALALTSTFWMVAIYLLGWMVAR
jgi:hypothetical protein